MYAKLKHNYATVNSIKYFRSWYMTLQLKFRKFVYFENGVSRRIVGFIVRYIRISNYWSDKRWCIRWVLYRSKDFFPRKLNAHLSVLYTADFVLCNIISRHKTLFSKFHLNFNSCYLFWMGKTIECLLLKTTNGLIS